MKAKRFKCDITSFEYIPNELVTEIFTYLSDVDAVYAFSLLNQRYQFLTFEYCQNFDFQSINKTKFDCIIQQHGFSHWQSLRLSDDDRTPTQIMYFYQTLPYSTVFTQMKYLSMINMKPNIHLFTLSRLIYFPKLVSLTIGFICGQKLTQFQLPTLKYLHINSCMNSQWMTNFQFEHVQYTIEHHCKHDCNLIWPKTIKKLKVFMFRLGDIEHVRNSFNDLSELTSLTLYDNSWENPPPDGQIWQKLIVKSIPKLQKFDFCFKFWKDFNISSDISSVISTFSTEFYLKEKSWFVQCDSHYQQLSVAMLYSLPFAFEQFDIITHSFNESLSTDKKSQIQLPYKKIKTISIDVNCKQIDRKLFPINIENLSLKSTENPIDWIYSLTQLRRLSLGKQLNISSKQFLCLLLNAPYLNQLNISYFILEILTNNWQNQRICNLLTSQIHSLTIPSDSSCQYYIKIDELVNLVRIFHQRCQHLNLAVRSRNLVAGFILKKMIHLRSLNVQLIEHSPNLMITRQWLIEQNSLFKKLNYSMTVEGNSYSFWFGRQQQSQNQKR